MKFGAFYDYLDKEHLGRFDRIASGHYARLLRSDISTSDLDLSYSSPDSSSPSSRETEASNNGLPSSSPSSSSSSSSLLSDTSLCSGPAPGTVAPVRLVLTPDAVKDQTYFLAHLRQDQLARAMFPLGGLTKQQVAFIMTYTDLHVHVYVVVTSVSVSSVGDFDFLNTPNCLIMPLPPFPQVRMLASAAELANKDRKDSQGICFLGKVSGSGWLRNQVSVSS